MSSSEGQKVNEKLVLGAAFTVVLGACAYVVYTMRQERNQLRKSIEMRDQHRKQAANSSRVRHQASSSASASSRPTSKALSGHRVKKNASRFVLDFEGELQ